MFLAARICTAAPRAQTRFSRAMAKLAAPIARQEPREVVFGAVEGENRGANPMKNVVKRSDPWFWLRDDDRKSEEILGHLRSENAFTEQEVAHLKPLMDKLYDEHISHLKETDDQAPYRSGDWFYYTRTVKGLSYKFHCRKPAGDGLHVPAADAAEQVLLDENKVAEGKPQCVVQGVRPCPDHKLLAYSVDFKGDETYAVRFLDLASEEYLPDQLEGVTGAVVWGTTSEWVFYRTQDEAKRSYKLWRHKMGQKQDEDVCLFTEADELFDVHHGKSKSGRFLVLESASTETTEAYVIDLEGGNDNKAVLIQEREFELRYDIEHLGENFLIWTNKDKAVNRRLMRVSVADVMAGKGGQENWVEVMPYDSTREIANVEVFKDFVAIEGRQDGLTQLWLMNGNLDGVLTRVKFQEELYEVSFGVNKVMDTPFLRLEYSSLTTPVTHYDYDMRSESAERFHLVKRVEVLEFDPASYVCSRLFAKAPDGTQIPMSVVHHKKADIKQSNPCFLYGYGSYGICIDPGFNRTLLPYLDRGVVYCIAHIRGGGEMGRWWYEEQGKYLMKRNTFSDFIACADHLVDSGMTTPSRLAIEGRSAGGLLMGNVLNMRPDLFQIAVAGVPFVDLMTTMCDPSIPLTTGEWEEWGNPNEWKYHDYMLSYSPLDNVRPQPYPNVLITAGLHDPRVAYWEPTKWATKLRLNNTSEQTQILLKMDLEVGHFSASDRYRYLKEKAFEQAIVLDKIGLATASKL
mmetsp:Transcript_19107/g.46842  ORF Transcript_19107/g.46842 Transcript_19107/m.46842 type:complete len:743 (+) Transcript_19107:33-2261(+)